MKIDNENAKRIIGIRIMNRRKQLGLKQKELAGSVGLTDNQISNIESGSSFPRMGNFLKICDVLAVTPDYFIVGAIRQSTNNNIYDLISQCNKDEQETICLLIETYIHRKDKNIF